MKKMKIILTLVFLLFLHFEAFATFSLPTSRSVTWQGNAGVAGGIPTRTTIYKTITSTGADQTSAIQTAINNCPSGQVVLLGSGTFYVSSLYMKSNVTLRGAGMGTTIIKATGNQLLNFGAYGIAYGTAVNLASGYSKGSTTITTSTAHGWSAGQYIVIDQLNNASGDPVISNVGDGGTNTSMAGRVSGGTRAMQQVVKLVSPTSGTTATLEIPIYMGFDSTKTPQGAKVTMGVENAGVEALTIDNSHGSYIYPVSVFNAANCWLYNVELNGLNASGMGVYLTASYRITITGCNIHYATGGKAPYDSYGITSIGTGSAYLIENNLVCGVTNGIVFQGGLSGSAIMYNYITNLYSSNYPTKNNYGIGFHGCYQYMNLFEGNVIDGAYFASDNYWGSNSNNTLFRNRIFMNYSSVDQQLDLGISQNQTYYNIIGNVLGAAGSETAYETNTTPYAPSSAYVYVTGQNGSSGTARSTMLRHANWDGYHQTQLWCSSSGEPGCQGGSTDQTLPSSFYYSSTPSWYSDECAYPAVDPTGSDDALRYSKIPAQRRYESLPLTPAATSNSGVEDVGSTSGGCFIATAAYGSYLAPHVKILRNFRDKHLITNAPGRMVVALYYEFSPPVAVFIANHETCRDITRLMLTPVTYSIEYPYIFLIFLVYPLYLFYRKYFLTLFQ